MAPARRLINLQILRFVAAALVVHVHAIDIILSTGAVMGGVTPGWLAAGTLENFGAAGVDLFFVISGLIITRAAAQARAPEATGSGAMGAAAFAWNRLWRVAPLYWLATAPWLAIRSGELSAPVLIATFTFWPAAGPEPVMPALQVGWTLGFELLFYAVVALIIASGRRRWAIGLALAAYAVCWIARTGTDLPAFQALGNPLILEFLLGVAAARILPRLSRAAGGWLLALGLAGFGAGLALGYGPITEAPGVLSGAVGGQRVLVWGLPAFLVVLGAVALETQGPPGALRRGLARLGDASYALYLTHSLALLGVAIALAVIPGRESGDLMVVGSLAGCVILALAVHRWIEQPILAMNPRLFSPARDRSPPSARTAPPNPSPSGARC